MSSDTLLSAGTSNLPMVEALYESYCNSPGSVDASWRHLFEAMDLAEGRGPAIELAPPRKPERREVSVVYQTSKEGSPVDYVPVYRLIQAYRTFGHLAAWINPLETAAPEEPPELHIETYGLSKQDLAHPYPTYGLLEESTAPLLTIIQTLKNIYCGKIGFEITSLQDPKLEEWIRDRIESDTTRGHLPVERKQQILQQVSQAELFESFLHTKYVGQKRFSLEGAEMLIPILWDMVVRGAEQGATDFILGMSHRGRLNVLSNIMNKSYAEIFSEFDENHHGDAAAGSGDVKYHKGYSADVTTTGNRNVHIDLSPNPSHLESVDPVVEGMARARQDYYGKQGDSKVIPLLIHGDASLTGEGVVYEAMQLSRLEGYQSGGTIHLVVNNQIGFTTLPSDGRSTLYCTDIAKAFGVPVFHVNSEDPESCMYVAALALDIRQQFHCDVFIDLCCYRKYGHNEGDEPSFTQPRQYQIIRKKKTIREMYRDDLIQEGVLEQFMAKSLEEEFKKSLHEALKGAQFPASETPKKNNHKNGPKAAPDGYPATSCPLDALQGLAKKLYQVPEGFNIHPKLESHFKEKRAMVQNGGNGAPLDWGMAETLAYASLLVEGYPVRISGQDVRRGTFSHRHAVWTDQQDESSYCSLQHLQKDQAAFQIYNSPLSEFSVLGFDFGYSREWNKGLVIWEAQFGDFANEAQVIIDQFIAVSEQKWGVTSGITLFLPHGYEGQGPEHSSGRLERYLSLCGHDNMRVVFPSTPAQFFHLLRQQAMSPVRKPLIAFTPKGLLRHPQCVSPVKELTEGSFKPVLDDPKSPSSVRRLVFCTGRIYYDLLAAREDRLAKDLALVRVEQLYPFPEAALKDIIERYEGCDDYFWVQEEPSNMGAWDYILPLLLLLLPKGKALQYAGRRRSAATAVGSHALHKHEASEIMEALFKGYELRMPKQEIGIKS